MNWLKILVGFSALIIAGCAAFFSVTGLGVLFSGASTAVMIMASSLELAKLVAATYLKQKWNEVKGFNKWYLTTAVALLMIITSAGIFGYLSNAFQQQNLKIGQIDREISVFQTKITQNETEITRFTNQINNLQQIRNSQEQNITKLVDKNGSTRRLTQMVANADKEISKISLKIDDLNQNNAKNYEEINKIKNENINVEKEIGGFRFVAEAFGFELNTVVKFFILLIVIVFDPLAVALIIAFNGLISKKEDSIVEVAESKDEIPSKESDDEEILKKIYEIYGDNPNFSENIDKIDSLIEEPTVIEEDTQSSQDDVVENVPPVEVSEPAFTISPRINEEQPRRVRIPIDLDNNGSIDGYDTDGDGMIDEFVPKTAARAREIRGKLPYYANPNFDWSTKSNWINDQNAVNFWMKYKNTANNSEGPEVV